MLSMHKAILASMVFVFYSYTYQERRCAIDIGSGSIKVQQVLFDCESNKIIGQLGDAFYIDVPLANYYAQDGELNLEIQQQAISAFNVILKNCANKNITKLAGIATEIFRKANESGILLFDTLKKLAENQLGKNNVNLQIVSQELEAKLGFLTAVASSPEIEQINIVSWDSGNASFQLALMDNNHLLTYEGKMGTALGAKLFIESIRKDVYKKGVSINPIASNEIIDFIDLLSTTFSVPLDFIQKIHANNKQVIGLGCPRSIFSLGFKTIGKKCFTVQDIYVVIDKLAKFKQDDEEIIKLDKIEPETVLIRLMLLYVVMKELKIDTVCYKESTGNALGVLLSPDFWIN